jgi:hypothetical protein
MDASYNKAEFKTALKIGLACGISVAVIELYYLLVGVANAAISQPIYQTLWLLTAFIFALAGILTARTVSKSVKSIFGITLYSGVAGAIAGILYIVSVVIVEFIAVLYDSLRYFYVASFLADMIDIMLSSVLWLPVIVAVAAFGGIIYATLTGKIEDKIDEKAGVT